MMMTFMKGSFQLFNFETESRNKLIFTLEFSFFHCKLDYLGILLFQITSKIPYFFDEIFLVLLKNLFDLYEVFLDNFSHITEIFEQFRDLIFELATKGSLDFRLHLIYELLYFLLISSIQIYQ